MKKMYVSALFAIVLSIATGCKKDTVNPTIVGYWTGTYGGVYGYAMLFRSNGTVRVFDDVDTASLPAGDKAEGTYTIGTDSVRTTYTFTGDVGPDYSTAAKMDAADTSMTGTYGYGTSTAGASTFQLSKH